MLTPDQKLAILNAWSEARPGFTEEAAYPYVVDMITSQVVLVLTKKTQSVPAPKGLQHGG